MCILIKFAPSGVIFQYCLVNASSWWILHVSSIFYAVMFPFKARMWKSKQKYIHLFLVAIGVFQTSLHSVSRLYMSQFFIIVLPFCIGLLIPLPGVIATLTMENYGHAILNSPPLFCGPASNDVAFYSVVLLINIFMVVGLPMLIIVIWSLHKV